SRRASVLGRTAEVPDLGEHAPTVTAPASTRGRAHRDTFAADDITDFLGRNSSRPMLVPMPIVVIESARVQGAAWASSLIGPPPPGRVRGPLYSWSGPLHCVR